MKQMDTQYVLSILDNNYITYQQLYMKSNLL